MKRLVFGLVLMLAALAASAQDVQSLPPLEPPADANATVAPVPAPQTRIESQVEVSVSAPAVAPAPVVEPAPAVVADLDANALFNVIYTEMTSRYGYPMRVGYTSAAAHLALCTAVGGGDAVHVAQLQIERMNSILWHIGRATAKQFHRGRFVLVEVFGKTLPQTQARIAAILACKQGNQSNARMVSELINFGSRLGIGNSFLDMQLGYNWEAAAMLMPAY